MNRLSGCLGIAACVAAGVSLTGCSSGGSSWTQALGIEPTSPDEFAVESRAPLTLPPDYNLRPPERSAAPAARDRRTGRRASSTMPAPAHRDSRPPERCITRAPTSPTRTRRSPIRALRPSCCSRPIPMTARWSRTATRSRFRASTDPVASRRGTRAMKSLWSDRDAEAMAARYADAGTGRDLALRVYTCAAARRRSGFGAAWRRQYLGQDGRVRPHRRGNACALRQGQRLGHGGDRAGRAPGGAACAAAHLAPARSSVR